MDCTSGGNIASALSPRVIDSSGKCSTCKKSAVNCYVTCLFCKAKFHAYDCTSESQDLCKQSFYKLFKPLTEKSGVNSHRPGNFKFICDPCLTGFEHSQVKTNEDHLNEIKLKVSSLEDGMDKVKKLLLASSAVSTPTVAKNQLISDSSTSIHLDSVAANWNDTGKTNSMIETLKINSTKDTDVSNIQPPTFVNHVKTQPKSILIINKNDSASIDKENMMVVNRTMIKEKLSITKSFKNKLGNTVLVCDSVEKRNRLRDEISKNIPDISLKAPPPSQPVIAVVGFDNEFTIGEFKEAFVNQNHFVSDFISLGNGQLEQHVNHLSTKPLKNNNNLFQALVRVSPELRELLKKFNDKIIIGSTRCRIYDRYNLKRCNKCFKFGHFAAKCTAETANCGFCAESHETSVCPNKSSSNPVCINCQQSTSHNHESNHPAYSFDCPVYKSHLNKQR